MQITVRLFATFRDGRGKELIMEDETFTIRKIISKISIEPEAVAIILVNGRHSTLDAELSAGDTVSLFPPVGGG